jgi:hypothetical protein
VDEDSIANFRQLTNSIEKLGARLTALTSVVGAMTTASNIEYERLEECIHFSARQLRASQRQTVLENASYMLEHFDGMQKVLASKVLAFKRPNPQR